MVRRRIAQELHDTVGAAIGALGEHLDAVTRELPESIDGELRQRLHESRWLLAGSLAALRKAVSDLRGPLLENHALPATLRWYAETVGRRAGVNIAVQTFGSDFRVPDEHAVCLLRVAQEAIEAVTSHAKAPNARLVLKRLAGRVRLSIVVEGLDLRAVEGAAERLAEMNQRVQAVDGRMKVEASPEKGTSITAEVAARR